MSDTGPTTRPARSAAIRFRPHHFLCAVGYRGKGYSPDFTANMTAVVMGRLRAPGGGGEMLEVIAAADDLCGPCPSREGAGCVSGAKIARLDASHAQALDLLPGDRLSWAAAQARIRERVMPGDLARVCAGCSWLAYGMCEEALAALHAAEAEPETQDAAR
ncbi:DUF1284 domain-containing protein [Frigidibacter sp. MR17.14]|uniref:DUF1284 domain-containing protein n=1 Tax=Frigidibacter sp. MR17.14 TaxID=3126509 RepID=UPI003012FF0F